MENQNKLPSGVEKVTSCIRPRCETREAESESELGGSHEITRNLSNVLAFGHRCKLSKIDSGESLRKLTAISSQISHSVRLRNR